MKIALYSDIHAQLAPLNAVLEDIDKENVDHEVIIGDMIMGGPEPSEVLERIRGREKAIPLLGNFDRWVMNRVDEQENPFPHRNESIRLTREHLADGQVDWLKTLFCSIPLSPEPGHDFLIFHGTPNDDNGALPLRLTDDEVRERLGGVTAEIMAFGQVHAPYIRQVGDQTLVCSAAVGACYDGDSRPAYSVVEYLGDGNWNAEIKRVSYDNEAQAKLNEEGWHPGGERQAITIRTGVHWNPDGPPH